MSVVPLTLTISLCLVFTFVLFFLREFTRRRFSGAESESLLPLADEMPRVVVAAAAPLSASEKTHAHSHDHPAGKAHVCHGNGTCSSCLKRASRQPVQTGA
ncbi:MAG: hypothetical protein ABW223_12875 [Rariglobus sp.]